jgi:hypothetical protein
LAAEQEHSAAEPVSVDMPSFANFAAYLPASNGPVAINIQGNTIGYFIPARRKRSETERATLEEAAARLAKTLAAKDSAAKRR